MADLGLVPTWRRQESVVDGEEPRRAHVLFLAFANGPLRDDVRLDVKKFGVSSVESVRAVKVGEHAREAAPEWFDGWRTGALRAIAERDLGDAMAALDAADHCFSMEVELPDPGDLAHLQSIWALARFFRERGACAFLDAFAGRFMKPADLPPVDAAFDVRREVVLIFETDATEPHDGHVVHTRGMGKLGRPDVVAVCTEENATTVGTVIWQLAGAMANGQLPALPRHGVDVGDDIDDEPWYLVADNVYAARLGLLNDARLLVHEDGSSLATPS